MLYAIVSLIAIYKGSQCYLDSYHFTDEINKRYIFRKDELEHLAFDTIDSKTGKLMECFDEKNDKYFVYQIKDLYFTHKNLPALIELILKAEFDKKYLMNKTIGLVSFISAVAGVNYLVSKK